MSHQTASKQIGKLAAAKFVDRIPSGRDTYCELSEPLMRICFEVKDNRTSHFRLFVEFLRHWFGTRELERRLAALQHDHDAPVLDLLHLEEALRCFRSDRLQPFFEALDHEAQRCLEAGDYQGLAAAKEIQVRERGDTHDFHMWVYALREAGDPAAAIAAEEESDGKYPPDPLHLNTIAQAYAMERRFDDALEAIDAALDLDPTDPSLHLCLRAEILLDLERYDDAISDADTVLAMEPDHWHSHYQAARAYFAGGLDNDARGRIAELVRLAPDNPRALRMASACSASYRKYAGALKLADQALALDTDDLESHVLRSRILFDMEDYESASTAFREVIARDPDHVFAHCRLSDALLSIGDYDEAIEVTGRLIELDPDHSHAIYSRAHALIELGRIPEAVADLDSLLPTEDFRSLTFAASEARRIGRFDSAARYLDRAAQLRPDDPEPWRGRALLHLDAGDYDAAAESAAQVETRSPDSLSALLLAMRVAAATAPLDAVFEPLDAGMNFDPATTAEDENVEAFSAILSVSVRAFGPRYLNRGVLALRNLLAHVPAEGILGNILTDFLYKNADAFKGSLEDWEDCLDRLADSLADQPDTQIPFRMLNAAVRYAKTADKKHLLGLRLEQRQLLADILPQQDA